MSGMAPRWTRLLPHAVVAALGWGACAPGLAAQTPPPPGAVQALWTLSPWATGVWLALLDRDGAYHGRFSPEGIFQRFDRTMDSEYDLDVRSGLGEPEEDVAWLEGRDGIRVRSASISPSRILHTLDWRQEVPMTDAVRLVLRYHRERSLTATRDYPWVGVALPGVGGSGWTLTAGLGVHFVKPSADVEVGASRRWTAEDGGFWRVDVGVVALDAFSDVIYQRIGLDEGESEALPDYRGVPLAVRGSVTRAARRWLVEVHGGSSTAARVDVTFPETGGAPFEQRERLAFAGALGQVMLKEGLDVAVYGMFQRATTDRTHPSLPDSDFGLREESRRVGALVSARRGGPWSLDARVERLWRPEERSRAGGPRVPHEDLETYGELALRRLPAKGWTARFALHAIDRDAGPRAGWLTAAHQRLTTEGGYRFASGVRITAGVRWDLEHVPDDVYDGAHVRLTAYW